MDTKRLKKFAKRYLARQRLRAKDKQITEWIGKEQKFLIEHLIDEGVDTVSLAGGTTLSTRTLIWAKCNGSKQEVLDALKECPDTKEFVKENFNHITLASYLRELDRENKPLPKSLAGIIEPDAVSNLIARKI